MRPLWVMLKQLSSQWGLAYVCVCSCPAMSSESSVPAWSVNFSPWKLDLRPSERHLQLALVSTITIKALPFYFYMPKYGNNRYSVLPSRGDWWRVVESPIVMLLLPILCRSEVIPPWAQHPQTENSRPAHLDRALRWQLLPPSGKTWSYTSTLKSDSAYFRDNEWRLN